MVDQGIHNPKEQSKEEIELSRKIAAVKDDEGFAGKTFAGVL